MKPEARETPSSEHEQGYQATSRCQGAALSLTSCRWQEEKKTCSGVGQSAGAWAFHRRARLSGSGSMKLSGGCTYQWLGGFLLAPHGKEETHPQVGQGTKGPTVAFPVCAFAFVVGACPGFPARVLCQANCYQALRSGLRQAKR